MRRSLRFALLALVLCPSGVLAQVRGLRFEGGPVFLTKSGAIRVGRSEIESDAGFALRGRIRYGLGPVSIAADVQSSNQKYGRPAAPGAPDTLDARFLGAVGALHPFRVGGAAPYGEIGLGRLFFGDDRIGTENGSTASSYALGVVLGGEGRVALDVGLRLMRLERLTATGVVGEFKYDPKLFSVLLSIKL